MKNEAEVFFESRFGKQGNFITPHVDKRFVVIGKKSGLKLYVEMSYGTSIARKGGMLYGVTVYEVVTEQRIKYDEELSNVFETKKEARKYVNELKEL